MLTITVPQACALIGNALIGSTDLNLKLLNIAELDRDGDLLVFKNQDRAPSWWMQMTGVKAHDTKALGVSIRTAAATSAMSRFKSVPRAVTAITAKHARCAKHENQLVR